MNYSPNWQSDREINKFVDWNEPMIVKNESEFLLFTVEQESVPEHLGTHHSKVTGIVTQNVGSARCATLLHPLFLVSSFKNYIVIWLRLTWAKTLAKLFVY